MQLASERTHTAAFIARLVSAGLTVGDATADGLTAPYVVVYPMAGGEMNGTLANPHDDEFLVWQTTSVGVSREQAEWLSDKVKASVLAITSLPVTGRSIAWWRRDYSQGVRRDDTTAGPPLFVAVSRWRCWSTPT